MKQAKRIIELTRSVYEMADGLPVVDTIRNRKKLTNEKVATTLAGMGLATRTEIEELRLEITALKREIVNLKDRLAKQSAQ